MMRVVITCQRCGKKIKVKPSRTERTKYCSWECRFPPVTKVCQQCGIEFRISPAFADRAKHCSYECYHTSLEQIAGPDHPLWGGRFPLACEECGKVTYVKKSLIGKRRFCSYRCRSVYTVKHGCRSPTDLEIAFAQALDEAQIDYEQQRTLANVAGVVDFVTGSLAIFVDGDFWHAHPDKYPPEEWYELQHNNHERDARHTAELQSAGYTVLRFWESDIRTNLSACIQAVKEHLELTAS